MSANTTHFEWKASESAPQYYPMQIISGTLLYVGASNGLYVPSGGILDHGWGLMRSSHNTGPALKPLPDRLDITFFSYMEDQFYRGRFDLPYDKILARFREVEAQPQKLDRAGDEIPNDFRIIVGVAPGGTVAVWLSDRVSTEVFFGQAQKVEMDFAKAIGFAAADRAEREEFLKKIIAFDVPPDILAAIRKTGIPFQQWANYRTQYPWTPTFAVSHPPKDFGMGFFNGEGARFTLPLEPVFTAGTHPVPDRISFLYAINGQGKRYNYIIHFDETETLAAFARLGAAKKPLQLEFTPTFPKSQTQIRLLNDQESIQLKKFTVEEW